MTYVTTLKSITLSNGSLLATGTKLRFTSTDGISVINFVTDGGFTRLHPHCKLRLRMDDIRPARHELLYFPAVQKLSIA